MRGCHHCTKGRGSSILRVSIIIGNSFRLGLASNLQCVTVETDLLNFCELVWRDGVSVLTGWSP